MPLSRLCLLGLPLMASEASAQLEVFVQDFESPGSEDGSDAGWTALSGAFVNVQFERTAAAAVSGDAGLRISHLASSGPVGSARLQRVFETPWQGRAYVRLWFRLSPQTGSVTVSPFQMRATAIGSLSNVWIIRTLPDGGQLEVRSSSAPAGAGVYCSDTAPFEFGVWHLLEADNRGVGSADAGYSGYLDGVHTCSADVSYEGVSTRDIFLGVLAGYEFDGEMDLDALAVARAPLPSKVVLAATELDGGCVAVTARVTASADGGFMPSPVTVSWSALEAAGTAAERCDSTSAVVTFSALDETRLLGAIRPRAGETTVRATAPNLLPGVLRLSVDAGPGPAAQTLTVACGCGSSALPWPLALLALCLNLDRRRRHSRVHRRPSTAPPVAAALACAASTTPAGDASSRPRA